MKGHLQAVPGGKTEVVPERLLGYAYSDGTFEPIGPSDLPKRHRRSFGREFVTMFTDALVDTAKAADLRGTDLRVLMYLMGTLGIGNRWQVFNQTDIAAEIGVERAHVNRAIKKLVERGVLIKGDKIGRGFAYSLNPVYGWRGTIEQHAAAIKSAPKLKLVRGGKLEQPAEVSAEAEMLAAGEPTLFGD
jgi:DNA-binding Lrp family transcriptional regulator